MHYDAHWKDRAKRSIQMDYDRGFYELWSPLRPRGLGLKGMTVSSASFCATIRGNAANPFRPTGLFALPF